MADTKKTDEVKKTVKVIVKQPKPKEGYFIVGKTYYKGEGKNRQKLISYGEHKISETRLTPESKTLLETYQDKLKDPSSKVVKVIT